MKGGDLLTDYEGIRGYAEYRNDLALLYLATLDAADGRVVGVRMVPLQLRRFRLNRATAADADWLRAVLTREGAPFGTAVRAADGALALQR